MKYDLRKKLAAFLEDPEAVKYLTTLESNDKLSQIADILENLTKQKEKNGIDAIIDERVEAGVDEYLEEKYPDILKEVTPIVGEDYFTEKDIQSFLRTATPVKGEDYFTKSEINQIISEVAILAKPISGKDYFTEKEIKEFLKRVTPKKGVDYFDGAPGVSLPGEPGKDGSPDTAEQIIKKINTQKNSIEVFTIKGLEELIKKNTQTSKSIKMHGGGSSTLAQLLDVNLGTLSNNDVLKYNSTTGKWENGVGGGGASPLTTKGDIYTYTTVDARLGVGTDGYVLTADSSTATGLKWAAVTGTGTVTDVSVVSANGFAGTVATSTTTPAITLSTTVTGILKGNGTAISAASAGTDYQAPITLTTIGTSGAATFIGNTLNIPQYAAAGSGVTSFNTRTGAVVLSNDDVTSTYYCGTAGGTANVITLTPTPAITAYAAGQRFLFKAQFTTTTTCTINVSGLGALNTTMGSSSVPAGGILINNLYWAIVDPGATTIRVAGVDSASVNGDTILGQFVFTGTNPQIKLGTASGNTGGIQFHNSANANLVTLRAGATSSTFSLTLPVDGGSNTNILQTDGTGVMSWVAKPTGTVTSVAMTVPTGLTITGSPVTTTGTLAVALDTGYEIPLTATIAGKADKSGALTQFVGNGNWKVWYSDGSGDVTELALGASGTYLKSNGAAAAPTFDTPAGSGTVTNTGGNLTANSVVLGAGTVDVKVVAGITTDGTSKLNLGVAGASTGKIDLSGSTSGTITIQPAAAAGTYTLTLPTTDGNANEFLQTNGSGVLTWAAATGGLTYWTEAQSTSAPNATVYVSSFTATGGATDIDAVVKPKGAGALLAQIPDSTATGGNKRGAIAVDFQMSRANANEVASGSAAILLGGQNNKSTNYISVVVGGYGNANDGSQAFIGAGQANVISAAGQYGFIGAGYSNDVTGATGAAVVAGDSNLASGTSSFVGAGTANTASGTYASVLGGNSNTASGTSTISGGYRNTATANYSISIGGDSNTVSSGAVYSTAIGGYSNLVGANTDYAFVNGYNNEVNGTTSFSFGRDNYTLAAASYGSAIGYYSESYLHGMHTKASGRIAVVGDAQVSEIIWRNSITGLSATELFLDGASLQAILKSSNTSWTAEIQVNATLKTVGNGSGAQGDMFSGKYLVAISRVGTSTVLKGTVQTIATTGNMTASVVTITADDTTEALKITFTADSAFAGTTTVTNVVAHGTLTEVRI